MDRCLSGADIAEKTLVDDLQRAAARGTFHPVLSAAPAAAGSHRSVGTVELLDLITGGFPTPAERPLPAVAPLHGAGRFDRAYARHEPMPPQLAARLGEEQQNPINGS